MTPFEALGILGIISTIAGVGFYGVKNLNNDKDFLTGYIVISTIFIVILCIPLTIAVFDRGFFKNDLIEVSTVLQGGRSGGRVNVMEVMSPENGCRSFKANLDGYQNGYRVTICKE
jgi:hypothetical protein